jgi:hypothetical protein
VAKLKFAPSENGLHYPNNWPSVPALQVKTPLGEIPIGNAANGLCGGMAFAVADLFEAHRMPPAATTNPAPESPAFDYIVARLFDSFNLPNGVAKYYEWMNLPTNDPTPLGPRGLTSRTIGQELPTIRETIDSGKPCPLGLVCVHSIDPKQLGLNHQVLAYGYDDNGATTTVWVYDCDAPDNDTATISFNTSAPSHTTTFHYSAYPRTVLGFFAVGYAAKDPSAIYKTSAP